MTRRADKFVVKIDIEQAVNNAILGLETLKFAQTGGLKAPKFD